MSTINLNDYKKEDNFTAYKVVLEALSKAFDQETERLDKALVIAGNFDTLIMFCTAARDMGMKVDEVAELSTRTTIPQMYLKEIRPKTKEKENVTGGSVIHLRKSGECQ